jgi:hypothetical protein
MGKRNKWDVARLSEYPEWFQKRDDSLELMSKLLLNDEDPKADDMEKLFDSVYVVCTEWETEVHDKPDVPVAGLYGFDTIKDMSDHLIKDWNKESITFVYSTRKKCYYEVETQLLIELKEEEKEEEEEVDQTTGVVCPDCKSTLIGSLPNHKKLGNCYTLPARSVQQREPLPGLQRGAAPAVNEVPPGSMGPRKS